MSEPLLVESWLFSCADFLAFIAFLLFMSYNGLKPLIVVVPISNGPGSSPIHFP